MQITGDSPIVDIRSVKGLAAKRALRYILKYISKPCSFDRPEDYAFFLGALKGVRRVHSYGILYDSEIEKPEREPTKCPICGSSLRFDRDFYRTFGSVAVSRLRYWMGIEPLVA